jgi:hypothetical protein
VTHRFGGSAIKGVPKEIKLSFANLPISVGIGPFTCCSADCNRETNRKLIVRRKQTLALTRLSMRILTHPQIA